MKHLDTNPIQKSVRLLYEAQQKKRDAEKYLEAVKKKEQVAISNFMFSNLAKGTESFDLLLDEGDYYENKKNLKVTRVRRRNIIWDIDKIKKAVSKPILKQVINKEYTITDMDGLVKYLKTCDVDPRVFKKYVSVSESINEENIDRLYETGEIKKIDVAGCYEVQLGEPYIRITEMEKKW